MISVVKCICSISTTASRRYSRLTIKRDPGVDKRKSVMNLNDLQDFGDVDLDDFEADFMNVNKSYKEHVREVESKQEQLKYLIVKQKYFKEKYPNFLTWHDKEQIRYLHIKDPEEWTVEKLSESFPALPEIIMKILKSKFTKSEQKIKNHDMSVEKNWEEFSQGKLENIPPILVEHLKKFTARKSNNPVIAKKQEIISKPKIKSEFADIITSYEKLKNKNISNQNEKHIKLDVIKKTNTDTYLLMDKDKMKDKRITTLNELQERIKTKAIKGKTLSEEEQVIYKDVTAPKENYVALSQQEITAIQNKYSSTGSSLMKKTEKDYSHLIYPEKIVIPKELKKRGYTYRLNDCYYDFDGEFLYRVPGMG